MLAGVSSSAASPGCRPNLNGRPHREQFALSGLSTVTRLLYAPRRSIDMAENYYTTNAARLHQYHPKYGDDGICHPHVRVRRTSPEDMAVSFSLGKRAATIHLHKGEAEVIASMILRVAAELSDKSRLYSIPQTEV